MKILVIDDRPENIEEAKRIFAKEELTTVTDFASAIEELKVRHDENKKKELEVKGVNWRTALEQSKLPFPYDMVLTDLMLPATDQMLSDKAMQYVGQEMPLGFVLAILAAKNGAKLVGLVTSMNHHQHPVSAAIDYIDKEHNIDGAKVVFLHVPDYSKGMAKPSGLKNWRKAVEKLTGEKYGEQEEPVVENSMGLEIIRHAP